MLHTGMFFPPVLASEVLLQLDVVAVKMVDEIDDHIEGQILRFAISLQQQLVIEAKTSGQGATSP